MKKIIFLSAICLMVIAFPALLNAQNKQTKTYYCQRLTYAVPFKAELKIKREKFSMYQTAVTKVTITGKDTTYEQSPVFAFIPQDLVVPVSGSDGTKNVGDLFLSLQRSFFIQVVLVTREKGKWVVTTDTKKGIYLIVAFGFEEPWTEVSTSNKDGSWKKLPK